MYGNKLEDRQASRIFPFIMSKMFDYFSAKYCRFNYSKAKEATARIALYKEL